MKFIILIFSLIFVLHAQDSLQFKLGNCIVIDELLGDTGKVCSTHLPEWDRVGYLRGKGGCGFDIRNDRKIDFQKRQIIVEKAIFCGFKGLGFANTFIHIDDAKRYKLTERWY